MKIDAQARLLATQALQNPTTKPGGGKEIVETAREFEAIFVQQVFKGMRRTIPDSGLLPRGNAEEIFYDMQDVEAAKQLTRHGGIGLSEMLIEQMTKDGG